MTAPSDPLVRTDDLASALGLRVHQVRLLVAGTPRPAKGKVPLVAALTTMLSAIRADTAEARAYRPAPLPRIPASKGRKP